MNLFCNEITIQSRDLRFNYTTTFKIILNDLNGYHIVKIWT